MTLVDELLERELSKFLKTKDVGSCFDAEDQTFSLFLRNLRFALLLGG